MHKNLDMRNDTLDDPEVKALLEDHYELSVAMSPVGKAHVFSFDRLKQDDITFWSFWRAGVLRGVGALQRLSSTMGELKSMHVAQASRRQGIGAAIVHCLEDQARRLGFTQLYLETGANAYFAPARRLYNNCGFFPCGPFGSYKDDRDSVYMHKEIRS